MLETAVRRFYALDDCGTRINPMVIEGQVHGGLTEAFGIAMGQEIAYDELGNVQGASLMDYFLPTAVETPVWETDYGNAKPTKTLKLESFGGVKPTPYPGGGTQIVRGSIAIKATCKSSRVARSTC